MLWPYLRSFKHKNLEVNCCHTKCIHSLFYNAVQNSSDFKCCLTCDVSFAPPAAVWIALNPTQVTMSFTRSSDFHSPKVSPLFKPAHLSGYQCSTRFIKTHVLSHILIWPYSINKSRATSEGKTSLLSLSPCDPSLSLIRQHPQSLMWSTTVSTSSSQMFHVCPPHIRQLCTVLAL